MTERPRGTCSVCGRDVALTAKTGVIGPHSDPQADRSRDPNRCDGAGQPAQPAAEQLAHAEDMTARVETRARQIVADLLGQVLCDPLGFEDPDLGPGADSLLALRSALERRPRVAAAPVPRTMARQAAADA